MKMRCTKKTLELIIFSQKRKGDVIARISADVNEVQNPFIDTRTNCQEPP
jgi:hypothetical protein